MPLHGTNRRTVLLAAGTAIAGALSGCAEVASELPGNDGEDDSTEAELRALIEDYFAAAEAENLDDVSRRIPSMVVCDSRRSRHRSRPDSAR